MYMGLVPEKKIILNLESFQTHHWRRLFAGTGCVDAKFTTEPVTGQDITSVHNIGKI